MYKNFLITLIFIVSVNLLGSEDQQYLGAARQEWNNHNAAFHSILVWTDLRKDQKKQHVMNGNLINCIQSLINKVNHLRNANNEHENKIPSLNTQLSNLNDNFHSLNNQLKGLETKVNKLEKKLIELQTLAKCKENHSENSLQQPPPPYSNSSSSENTENKEEILKLHQEMRTMQIQIQSLWQALANKN